MNNNFPYIVRKVNKDEHDVKIIVEYIDFPGIIGGGDTLNEALKIAEEGLDMYIDLLISEGKEIPSPYDFDATGRITLRTPKSVHLIATEMANREGVSLNTYINNALLEKIYKVQVLDEISKNK